MNLSEMARRCYGYGDWSAPYWFIGLEEGKGRNENSDNVKRMEVWKKLERDGLSDCRDFHDAIGESDWHGKKATLQKTWRPLLLLLRTFLEKNVDKASLLSYQKTLWGRSNGETCLIELSSLAARNLRTPSERQLFRDERIAFI